MNVLGKEPRGYHILRIKDMQNQTDTKYYAAVLGKCKVYAYLISRYRPLPIVLKIHRM